MRPLVFYGVPPSEPHQSRAGVSQGAFRTAFITWRGALPRHPACVFPRFNPIYPRNVRQDPFKRAHGLTRLAMNETASGRTATVGYDCLPAGSARQAGRDSRDNGHVSPVHCRETSPLDASSRVSSQLRRSFGETPARPAPQRGFATGVVLSKERSARRGLRTFDEGEMQWVFVLLANLSATRLDSARRRRFIPR